jgi:hypothetical protein
MAAGERWMRGNKKMNRSENANTFTILDWIGIFFVVANLLGLFAFPMVALSFKTIFMEIGGVLPALTKVVLKPWFPILLGMICLCIFSLQWLKAIRGNLRRKRTVVVLSFFAASTAFALCVIGLYLPIFKIVGSV